VLGGGLAVGNIETALRKLHIREGPRELDPHGYIDLPRRVIACIEEKQVTIGEIAPGRDRLKA
jgi:hypothetical protein